MNKKLIIAGILGLISVIIGSYTEHALKKSITAHDLKIMMVGIRYHQLYSILLAAIALLTLVKLEEQIYKRICILFFIFCTGICIFSFSIYASIILGIKQLTYITPFGGITIMAGWGYMVWMGVKARKVD